MSNESISKNEYMRRYFAKPAEELERERIANMTARELGKYWAEQQLEELRVRIEEDLHGS